MLLLSITMLLERVPSYILFVQEVTSVITVSGTRGAITIWNIYTERQSGTNLCGLIYIYFIKMKLKFKYISRQYRCCAKEEFLKS